MLGRRYVGRLVEDFQRQGQLCHVFEIIRRLSLAISQPLRQVSFPGSLFQFQRIVQQSSGHLQLLVGQPAPAALRRNGWRDQVGLVATPESSQSGLLRSRRTDLTKARRSRKYFVV